MILNFPAGVIAEAAAELVTKSALNDILDTRGGTIRAPRDGSYSVHLPADTLETLSTGETYLWHLLMSIGGLHVGITLWHVADRLDDRNRAAVADAVAVLMGARAVAGVAW